MEAIDPNTIVGWIAFISVTAGALWRIGKWIVDLRNDVQRAVSAIQEQTVKLEVTDTRIQKLEMGLSYLAGAQGVNLSEIIGSGK